MKTLVTEYRATLEIEDRVDASKGVVGLTLRHPHGELLPEWSPGAHIDLLLADDLVRQYSLCGDPHDRTRYRIAVLREPNGRGGSDYVHDKIGVGSQVEVRGPRNNFPLVPAPRYIFVAGGIGITPILPMIAQAQADGAEWRLFYGGRTRENMAFREELKVHGEKVTMAPQDEVGLLDLPGCLAEATPDTKIYCCGPEPLLAAIEDICRTGTPGALHVERFAAKQVVPGRSDTACEVELRRSGLTITVPADKSILDAVEEAGVGVLSSCREGTCGTCETTVVEGVPDHRDSILTEDEQEAGDLMLICVSRSCTPRLVLEL